MPPVVPTAGRRREPTPDPRPAAAPVPAAAPAPAAGAPADSPRVSTPDPRPVAAEPGSPRRRRPTSWLPIGVAAAAVAAVVLAVALASGGGDGAGDGKRASSTTPKSSSSQSDGQKAQASSETASNPPPASPPPAAETGATSAQDATALNNQGYDQLRGGNAAGAVPLLKRSVDGFRSAEALSNINYHYALYNLAEALMANGQPAEAVPYLQERLERSDDRRGLVQQTLDRAQAGETTVGGAKKPKDKNRDDG